MAANQTFQFRAQTVALFEEPYCALMNRSDGDLLVTSVDMDETGGGVGLNQLWLKRCSDYEGGWPMELLKSNNGDPDCVIEARKAPRQVVEGSILRKLTMTAQNVGNLGTFAAPSVGSLNNRNAGLGEVLTSTGDSLGQGIILAPGEGLCMTNPPNVMPYPYSYSVFLLGEILQGGDTYYINGSCNLAEKTGYPMVLFNPAGSGVDVEVKRLYFLQTGPTTNATATSNKPVVRLEIISGVMQGDEAEILKRSTTEALPATIKAYINKAYKRLIVKTLLEQAGVDPINDLAFPQSNVNAVRRGGVLTNRLMGVSLVGGVGSTALANRIYSTKWPSGWAAQSEYGILLKPNQGLCVRMSNLSAYSELSILMEATYIPPATGSSPPPSGGGGGRRTYIFGG